MSCYRRINRLLHNISFYLELVFHDKGAFHDCYLQQKLNHSDFLCNWSVLFYVPSLFGTISFNEEWSMVLNSGKPISSSEKSILIRDVQILKVWQTQIPSFESTDTANTYKRQYLLIPIPSLFIIKKSEKILLLLNK